MSVDFSLSPTSLSGASAREPEDDVDAPTTWTEIIVTAAVTSIAVLFVSFVAVLMGLA